MVFAIVFLLEVVANLLLSIPLEHEHLWTDSLETGRE
jgi:hypothetical protein